MAEVLNLEFWGVRGTCPVSGNDQNTYGGHTPCSSLETSDRNVLIVDAGTGIKKLGDKLQRERGGKPMSLHLLLTHFHLDHIMGLPFFMPLFSPEVTLFVYANCSPEETEENLSGLMAGRYFPVSLQETQSRKIFIQIREDGIEIGGSRITFSPLNHPQGSVAYKIHAGNEAVVFATDTEHPLQGVDEKLVDFASGTDILVYDAMFTPGEYESGRMGWGHSTWLEGIKLTKKAGVRKLYLSHFNPDHNDNQIDQMITLARDQFPDTYGAREKGG
jgi:phosphoribosyl 1,2-cyclic phosphodiesterase